MSMMFFTNLLFLSQFANVGIMTKAFFHSKLMTTREWICLEWKNGIVELTYCCIDELKVPRDLLQLPIQILHQRKLVTNSTTHC